MGKGMSKRLERQVKAVAKEAVEEVRETKYVSDLLNGYTSYTPGSSDVDLVGHRMFTKIPLVVPAGDDYKSRDGDKIELKDLTLRFRVRPIDDYDMIAISSATPGTNMFPKTVLKCHLLRVDKTASITAGEIDQCIRRPQELWVDNKQSVGKSSRKAFTIVGKFDIDLKYREIMGINSGTIPPEATLLRVPQLTFLTKRFKLDKVTQFNASSSNEPVKYDYYLFATWGRWNRGNYEVQNFPQTLDLWKTFTFKDM
jgi:hypothetical protein